MPKPRRFKETTITTSSTTAPATSSPHPMSPSAAFSHGDGDVRDQSVASSFSKFNTALTAGLLNPMSPPPQQLDNGKTRSSPTLFEMMSDDVQNGAFMAHRSDLAASNGVVSSQYHSPQRSNLSVMSNGIVVVPHQHHQKSNQSTALVSNGVVAYRNKEKKSDRCTSLALNDVVLTQNGEIKQELIQRRLREILAIKMSPENRFNDSDSGDLMLTLSSEDGVSVDVSVHRQILVAHSSFFGSKLSDQKWIRKKQDVSKTCVVEIEIEDCDDLEVYVETLRLMYCKDLRRRLMKEDVCRVLGILKISAAIGFDAGILSCLEYLEAAPWSEDEEEEISALLSQLQLDGIGSNEVLKRVSLEYTSHVNNNEQVLLKLLQAVLEGKDERARREMKGLLTKMLRENSSQKDDLSKESLYIACDNCLKLLCHHFLTADEEENSQDIGQIAKQADNLHWLLDILIDRQIAEDFLNTWASLSELSKKHCKVPVMHRFKISNITARFFVAIGKRQMLASKEARCMLLQTWLIPFYKDFGWMKKASKGLDRNLIEEGLSNTVSTLPLNLQQEILLSWFDRYLNSGEDCPNIQRAFEVWWRRAFLKRDSEVDRMSQMRIVKVENM